MLVYEREINEICSANAWSFNTINFTGGRGAILTAVYLANDTDEEATFQFTIKNKGGHVVWPNPATQYFTGFIAAEMRIPLHGVYTCAVADCENPADVFKGRLMIEEYAK